MMWNAKLLTLIWIIETPLLAYNVFAGIINTVRWVFSNYASLRQGQVVLLFHNPDLTIG